MKFRITAGVLLIAIVAIVTLTFRSSRPGRTTALPPGCDDAFLRRPVADTGAASFETQLYAFLERHCYSNWIADARIRDSGPFIGGKSFGTHDSVQVYYSPEIWDWLKRKHRTGPIPDGATIVKVMFAAPAVPGAPVRGWTAMVKDARASYDGWYWSYHAPNETPERPDIDYPDSGPGLYCLRCHASAERESTFITAKNVEGDPISFRVLVPTMKPLPAPERSTHDVLATALSIPAGRFVKAHQAADPAFLRLFATLPGAAGSPPKRFPGEALDHVTPNAGGPRGFITSSQCLGCHSASDETMAVPPAPANPQPINLSPYTEWRASMMGLAGRDPIFHAQLESEKAIHPTQEKFLDNTCYRCHGAMGQRQLESDTKRSFEHQMVYARPEDRDGKYGALARDGISCAVCHQMSKEGLGTQPSFTGKFKLDPPDVVNGPYNEVIALPMKQALGITPRHGDQIASSALCGSCHTVILPVFDAKGQAMLDASGKPKEFHEQMTYPEWQNSVYQNEREPIRRDAVRTCQDCHMQRTFQGRPLAFRAANIEDETYPYTDYRAPDKDLRLRVRDQYGRHTLIGLNQFGLMMFEQFPDILGIRTADYGYAAGAPGLATAQKSSDEMAKRETARIELASLTRTATHLQADVRIENLAGHGFPSGVGFRRAFITCELLDGAGKVIWASGRTNSAGAIVNGVTDEVLPTEFFYDPITRAQVFQPHHEVITDERQVQIYEELIADPEGKITTSFVSLNQVLKNNRLLPKGWRPDGPFGAVTGPHGDAERDPEYSGANGASGSDRISYRIPLDARTRAGVSVRMTLNYQATPPSYLKDRFTLGKGAETERLAYIASHLNVDGSAIAGWKLPIVSATRRVGER